MILRRLGVVPYDEAWRLQQSVHAEVADGAEDTVLLLEHPPVYSAGKRTSAWERPVDGTPVQGPPRVTHDEAAAAVAHAHREHDAWTGVDLD